jgi:hypothetical protein
LIQGDSGYGTYMINLRWRALVWGFLVTTVRGETPPALSPGSSGVPLTGLALAVEMIKALAWPIAVLIIVFMLRHPLTALFVGIKGVKYKGVELEFGKELAKLEERAELIDEIPSELLMRPVQQVPPRQMQGAEEPLNAYVERLAAISPRAAITEAWRRVELAMREAANRTDSSSPPTASFKSLVNVLEAGGMLPRKAIPLLQDLRNLAIGRSMSVNCNWSQLRRSNSGVLLTA